MWNKTLVTLLFVFNAGCSTVNSHVPPVVSGSKLETCKIIPDVMLKGQLLVHYHGMTLKVAGCPPNIPVEQDLKFNNAEELNKIWAVLPYPRNKNFYVDIDFFASETVDGDILIERIIHAEHTEESQFDDEGS